MKENYLLRKYDECAKDMRDALEEIQRELDDKLDEILDELNSMHGRDEIEYDAYSSLFDMVSGLKSK